MVLLSTAERSTHLPTPLTRLVGRAREGAAVTALVKRPDIRLVTLTGPGGIGKTRLAIEVAAHIAGDDATNVMFVPLAPVRDATLVIPTIAQAFGIREDRDRSLGVQLAAALGNRHLLLVLDNLEHVLVAAPDIAELLVTYPNLTILGTSRSVLRLSGEHAVVVPPLALPATDSVSRPEELVRTEAVALFVERAQAADSGFALTAANARSVAAICELLDGLPLAIELAAARLRVFTTDALLAHLSEPLRLLTGGARDQPPRLRTMRDAVAWSHELLSPPEQTLFRRLAVFIGGCTLEAAEAVCSEPGLDVVEAMSALVEQSLIQRLDPVEAAARYGMLETVRALAMEQLAASGEVAAMRARHAAYFTALAEQGTDGPHAPTTSAVARQFAAERANVLAALTWEIEQGASDLLLRLVAAGWWYWNPAEGIRILERAVAAIDRSATSRQGEHAILVATMGELTAWLGDLARAISLLDQALVLAREADEPRATALALLWLGVVLSGKGELERAEVLGKESLMRWQGLNDPGWFRISDALCLLGVIAVHRDDPEEAEARFTEMLEWGRQRGADRTIAGALECLGTCARERGDQPRAARLYAESLAQAPDYRDPITVALCVKSLGAVAAATGRPEQAARLFGAAEAMREAQGVILQPVEHPRLERAIAPARAQLTETAFAAAWASGRALPVDQAIVEALAVAEELAAAHPPDTVARHGLSPRELEVLRLLAEGRSNREIATGLSLSERTIENHVLHILTKLSLSSRTAATAYAIRHGLA